MFAKNVLLHVTEANQSYGVKSLIIIGLLCCSWEIIMQMFNGT